MTSPRTSSFVSTTSSPRRASWCRGRGTAWPSGGARRWPIADFASLVDQVRSGPPPGFFRIRWVRQLANLNEFFVHHEDVRRANGRGPRTNPPELDAALWRNVARTPWFLARRLHGAGLELEWAGTSERVRARRGEPVARLVGAPGEVLLYLFGRRAVAEVEIAGPPAAVAAVRDTAFGM